MCHVVGVPSLKNNIFRVHSITIITDLDSTICLHAVWETARIAKKICWKESVHGRLPTDSINGQVCAAE